MKTEFKDESLNRYMTDIRKVKPISREEEYQLFLLVAKGNRRAKDRLVEANMRFVLKVAVQYRVCNIPLPDLVNEGAMGLIRAIESFDYSRGLKFITYAVWWVKAYITRAINERGSLVRLPANQHLRLRKAIKEQIPGQRMDEEIQGLLRIGEGGISLDSPLDKGSKLTFSDVLSDDRIVNPDDRLERDKLQTFTSKLLSRLPEREAQVIASLHGIGMDLPQTVREVGATLKVSRERVRQLRDQGMSRIRNLNIDGHLSDAVNDYMSLAEVED